MSTDDENKAVRKAQAARLKKAREHLMLANASDAWRKYKLPGKTAVTYQHHENGTRGMGRAAHVYASAYGVPVEWLLYGNNPPEWARSETDLEDEQRVGEADHFLRPWRLFRGLTENELADMTHVPVDLILDWEAGKVDLSGKNLRRIATALRTTPGLILDVDPAAVPPAVLETWLKQVDQQREVRAQLGALRTGTIG